MSEEFKDREYSGGQENQGMQSASGMAPETAEQERQGGDAADRKAADFGDSGAEVRQTVSDPDAAQSTTYSWVNPKIQGRTGAGERELDMEKHAAERVEPDGQERAHGQVPNGYAYTGGTQGGSAWEAQGPFQFRTAQEGAGAQEHREEFRQSGQTAQGRTHEYYHVNAPFPQQPAGGSAGKKQKRKGKVRQPMGTGKKWALNLSMALVFGLVAGGVMYGVNYLGGELSGETAAPVIQNTATAPESAESVPVSSSGENGAYTVQQVAANAMPSMVAISTETVETVQSFFGTYNQTVPASGSGVIVGQNDTELLIATNNHVVEGANKLSVSFIDDETVEAQVKGTDADADLAVVAVQLSDIPQETMGQIKVATLGDSDSLEIGEGVVAIGNALGYGQSVTDGIISALDRKVQTQSETTGQVTESDGLIQTNAAINPGNSGGALLNMKGELIGINEAKYSSTDVEGMGFAIPLSKAEPILENLMSLTTRSKVDDEDASYLGITGMNVSEEVHNYYGVPLGVLVGEVEKDGPADQAGIQEKDVITEIDGRKVTTMTDLQNNLQYYAKGETVEFKIQRMSEGGYTEQTVTVTLGDRADMQISADR